VKNGQPIKAQSGRTFTSFINALRKYGYNVDYRELRACDYGAPTIRKRFFLIARCDGKSIIWPKPTHGDPASEAVKVGALKPWRTAADIINWTLPCPSIFDTSEEIWEKHRLRIVRLLAESTLKRIARGLQKFVFENPEPFIVDFKFDNSPKRSGEPLNTTTSVNGYGIVTSTLIQYHSEQSDKEVRGQSLKRPLFTVDGANRYGLVMAFMSKYYSGGHRGSGNEVTEPLNTVTAIDHNALVTSQLVKFKGKEYGHSTKEPMRTITAGGGNYGEARAFLIKYYGQGDAQGTTEPLHTVNAQDRFGLVTIHGEQYAIADIGLRMLTPRELFNAQGFPPDYAIASGIDGKLITKTSQVARCGNAVPPPFAEALVRANLPEICGVKIGTMAGLKTAIAI